MTKKIFLASAAALAFTPVAAFAQEHDLHAGHDMNDMQDAGMDHDTMDHQGMDHDMSGALGDYPMTREASGTAWAPDTSRHEGWMTSSGDWTLMLHGNLDLVYSDQSGPRGDEKLFVPGMLMGMAKRPLGEGTLQLRGMVSPDPLMGKTGYPLLLASGETADGVEHLVDRQHPHDFFMELSASVSQPIGENASAFFYGGLPGEPAFGPPAFMHRQSINTSPAAPISHHWLDSAHITFGVLTAGVIVGDVKVEASRFNGREPDQFRWNIETAPLNSTSVRLSANPMPQLSLQASWADLKEPEQLEPGVDQKRWSASASYTRQFGEDGWWATTAAWGRKTIEGESDDAWVLESSVGKGPWTLFGRAERTENSELVEMHDEEGEDDHHDEGHGVAWRVGKIELGAMYEVALAKHVGLGIGASYAFNFVPSEIETLYGGDPEGVIGFLRLKIR